MLTPPINNWLVAGLLVLLVKNEVYPPCSVVEEVGK
jgi:hypothetical protein